jgi:hypothetical protein
MSQLFECLRLLFKTFPEDNIKPVFETEVHSGMVHLRVMLWRGVSEQAVSEDDFDIVNELFSVQDDMNIVVPPRDYAVMDKVLQSLCQDLQQSPPSKTPTSLNNNAQVQYWLDNTFQEGLFHSQWEILLDCAFDESPKYALEEVLQWKEQQAPPLLHTITASTLSITHSTMNQQIFVLAKCPKRQENSLEWLMKQQELSFDALMNKYGISRILSSHARCVCSLEENQDGDYHCKHLTTHELYVAVLLLLAQLRQCQQGQVLMIALGPDATRTVLLCDALCTFIMRTKQQGVSWKVIKTRILHALTRLSGFIALPESHIKVQINTLNQGKQAQLTCVCQVENKSDIRSCLELLYNK